MRPDLSFKFTQGLCAALAILSMAACENDAPLSVDQHLTDQGRLQPSSFVQKRQPRMDTFTREYHQQWAAQARFTRERVLPAARSSASNTVQAVVWLAPAQDAGTPDKVVILLKPDGLARDVMPDAPGQGKQGYSAQQRRLSQPGRDARSWAF